jgi:alanyl-tRNA synthetase
MGETGPCGPCSEIYYDFGREAAEDPAVDKPFPEDEQRYVEIWNLVFMQFDRAGDGTLTPLPKPSIDTGMGLERIACVLQGVLSNYQTDLFLPLIGKARELTGRHDLRAVSEEQLSADSLKQVAGSEEKGAASLRIIADHARCATFLISDGVIPANEGRGYVLRKIMRRGIRHGRLLGQEKPFLHEMVFAVRDEMADAYPELKESAERVSKVVLAEEQQFARTLELGLRQMNEETLRSGAAAFHLYETFGMPLDFMVDAARDAGIAFDMEGFEAARQEEQARARASWKGGSQKSAAPVYRELAKTEFEGYSTLRVDGAQVLALVKDGVGAAE